MKLIDFTYEHARVTESDIKKIGNELQSTIITLKKAVSGTHYDSLYASLSLPADKKHLNDTINLVQRKKSLKPTLLIVIGIGGSNLGTIAVEQALYGCVYPEDRSLKVYYADTVDSSYTQSILSIVQRALEQGEAVLLTVISKSGTTVETIALFEIFLALLIKYNPATYNDYIVIITDSGSLLHHLALEKKFDTLLIPEKVGGRYSVFSAVGLFPLGMMDVDLPNLLQGAYTGVVTGCDNDIYHNIPALSAALLFVNYARGFYIHDLFLFSKSLESVGKWYRQLVGESLGKMYDITGNKVNRGITPTVSVGSIDLHSVGQLYLAGPYDKYTSFVYVESEAMSVQVPYLNEFEKVVNNIQGKSLAQIMDAIFKGTQIAYMRGQRPFVTFTLAQRNAFFIGQLLQIYMMQIMYLGVLMKVNPFDQPEVELYKKETRDILAHD